MSHVAAHGYDKAIQLVHLNTFGTHTATSMPSQVDQHRSLMMMMVLMMMELLQ
jgi:hypothetical protein